MYDKHSAFPKPDISLFTTHFRSLAVMLRNFMR